jgi:hypothetical protein
MKNLILGAAVVALAAACGGGGKPQLLDANIDAPVACNPVAQTGCMAGEKCTWVVDIDGSQTMNDIGHVGCAPVGAAPIAEGGTCVDATATANAGADNCAAGTLCIARQCKPICDPQVAGAAAGSCKTDFACSLYAGVFESAGTAIAGVCDPQCDPLTQQLKVGTTNIDACGSADPTKPTSTCVRGARFANFTCAPTGSMLYPNTDRQTPFLNPGGLPYPNGCAPGFIPFFIESQGSMKTLCSGLCKAVKMDKTIFADGATPANVKPWGDTAALGKLTTEAAPKAGNAVCTVGVKGSIAPTDPQTGAGTEDCRFLWFPLAISNGGVTKPVDTPYNNTLGICFAYSKFVAVDTNGDMTPDAPEKSCSELGTVPDDIYGTADENGCYPIAGFPGASAQAGSTPARKATRRAAIYRLSLGDEPLARHILAN